MSALAGSMLAEIASMIAAYPLLSEDAPGFQQQGEEIARLCVNRGTFETLDERPGLLPAPWNDYRSARAGEWHIKLRRARNGCDRFFDVLGGERVIPETYCSECATYDPRGDRPGPWHSKYCSMWEQENDERTES